MLVRVLWAGRYGRGAVDRSDALAAEVLVRALLARVLLCVAQMAQEDAGDAGDADDSDAPAAHRTKRSGKTNRKQRQIRARARQQMVADTDSEGGL